MPLLEFLLLSAVITYLVTNRGIVAIVTIPGGLSIHPSMVVLGVVALLATLNLLHGNGRLPKGSHAFWGLATVALLLWMPFILGTGLHEFERRQFDQGVVHVLAFLGLYVAVYQLSARRKSRVRVLIAVIAVSVFQAGIAIIEMVTKNPFQLLNQIWLGLGLNVDPRGIQTFASAVNARITGELRPASTAPHPIIMSALMSLALFVSLETAIHSTGRRRIAAFGAAAICGLTFVTNNSRTGYLMAVALGSLFLFWHFTSWNLMRGLMLSALAGVSAVAALSPGTFRFVLNLVTFTQTDNTAQVRFDRIPIILDYLERRPFLGAGYLTHSVIAEQLWDNAYLHALSELGMIGTAVMLCFFVSSGATMWHHTLENTDAGTYSRIGMLTVTGLLVGATSVDIFTFPQFLPTAIVLIALGVGTVQSHERDVGAPIRSLGGL